MGMKDLILQNKINLDTKWEKKYPNGKIQIAIGKLNTIASKQIKFIHHKERHTARSINSVGISNDSFEFKPNDWALACFYKIYNFNSLEKFISKAEKLNCSTNMIQTFVNYYMQTLTKENI